MRIRLAILFPVLLLCVTSALAQLRQVAAIELPGRPGFDGVAYLNGYVVIAHTSNNTLDVFDTAKRRLLKQVEGMNDPRGLAIDPQDGLIYVANAGNNSVAVIAVRDWSIQRTIQLDRSPENLLLADGKLYVTNWRDRSISVLDLASKAAATTIDIDGSPQHMVYDSARKVVFAVVQDTREVVAIDAGHKIARRYALMASQPTGLALDTDQRRLYVAVRYAVVVLNADTGAEVSRIAAPAGADSLWFDEPSDTLYVASTDGSVLMVRGGRNLMEIQTDVKGHTLAFDPGKSYLYLPGGREGRAKLVILKPVTVTDPNAPVNAGLEKPAAEAKTQADRKKRPPSAAAVADPQ